MPIIKSAIKRMKQSAKRRTRNVGTKRDVKTAVKAFIASPTSDGLSKAHAEIDTAVKKNILKVSTAARRKSQLSKLAKASGVKLTAKSTKKTAPKATAKPAVAKTAAKPATKKATTKAPVKKTAVAKKPAVKKAATKKTK